MGKLFRHFLIALATFNLLFISGVGQKLNLFFPQPVYFLYASNLAVMFWAPFYLISLIRNKSYLNFLLISKLCFFSGLQGLSIFWVFNNFSNYLQVIVLLVFNFVFSAFDRSAALRFSLSQFAFFKSLGFTLSFILLSKKMYLLNLDSLNISTFFDPLVGVDLIYLGCGVFGLSFVLLFYGSRRAF